MNIDPMLLDADDAPPVPDDACEDGFWVGRGDTVAADFSQAAATTLCWTNAGQFAVGGFEVVHLPEPAVGDTARVSRAQANATHRAAMNAEIRRVLRAVYPPPYFRGRDATALNAIFSTFDLRLTNWDPERRRAGSRVRIYLLVKTTAQSLYDDPGFYAATRTRAKEYLRGVLARLAAVFPRDVVLRPICFTGDSSRNRSNTDQTLAATPEDLGLRHCPVRGAVDIRRGTVSMQAGGLDYDSFLRGTLVAAGLAVPHAWPLSEVDLTPTCAALSAAEVPLVVSVRLVPTELTVHERVALAGLAPKAAQPALQEIAPALTANLARFGGGGDWFQSTVQIACLGADDAPGTPDQPDRASSSWTEPDAIDKGVTSVLDSLSVTFIGEHTGASSDARGAGRVLGRVRTIEPHEVDLARHNLTHLEMLPWGAGNAASAGSYYASIQGSPAVDVPRWGYAPSDLEAIKDPEEFLPRDWNTDPRLVRLRGLLTLEEAAAVFRLPIVPSGGQAGLVSRIKNPFEQLPDRSEREADTVIFGGVQHRLLRDPLEFRMPLVKRIGDVSGILDRVMIVAGSPGSGKTNFCLSFLRQLAPGGDDAGAPRHPFLVIDPTRGNEFRGLLKWVEDLRVFTVGDERGVPFCFNPFIVPPSVSVQAHLSRLMSCFKAAYSMWDPLPAIFELALRLAYEARRKDWWEARPGHGPGRWTPAIDFPMSLDEPFPTLDDLVGAMGRGEAGETFLGRPTVMTEQKKMWGEGTENSATVVASTFLRLNNLRQNYSHILGGGEAGRPSLDIGKLLDVPAVLELGMVGDAQALSLVMGFLIVSIAGFIEQPATAERPRQHRYLVIEEAHRLLSGESGGGKDSGNSKAQAAEDINNMLAEVRKYKLGVMLIDQRPGSLVGGVIDNAYAVAMHRLNEEKSFNQFAKVLNLSADQQRFARTELRPGEMITLDRRSGLPVLLRAEDLDTSQIQTSDEALKTFWKMSERVEPLLMPASATIVQSPTPPTAGQPADGKKSLLDLIGEKEGGAEKVSEILASARSFLLGDDQEGKHRLKERFNDMRLFMVRHGFARRSKAQTELTDALCAETGDDARLREFLDPP